MTFGEASDGCPVWHISAGLSVTIAIHASLPASPCTILLPACLPARRVVNIVSGALNDAAAKK